MRQRFTLITLGVEDLQRAVNFYEKGLGWERSSASVEDMVIFSIGGMGFSLYPRHLLAQDITIADGPCSFSGITLAYNCFSEKEVDEVMARAEKAGANILKPAEKVFWGGYSGYFRDPEGHIIEVAHNPFWEMSTEGDLKLPA